MKILLCDDQAVIRDGLEMLLQLEKDFQVVGSAQDGFEAVDLASKKSPDLVLMDLKMPGMNGIEGVKAIRSRYPQARILMQTVFEDDDKVFDAICAGASGYILKTASADDMVGAIRSVHAGGSPMTPSIAKKVLERFRASATPAQPDEGYNLSPRERDVLGLLVKGRSYKMIADELGISFHTVDSHIRKIYDKLHVSGMAEADAIIALTDADLQIGQRFRQLNPDVPAGDVIDTDPGAKSKVAPGTFVDLAPRVADGLVRLTRDHAPRAVAGVVIHLVREPAHADLLGFRSDAATGDDAIPLSMVRPKPGCQKKARAHN